MSTPLVTSEALRDLYPIRTCGTCLGRFVPEGSLLIADPNADLRPMDLCSVTMKGTLETNWGNYMLTGGRDPQDAAGYVKVFLGRYEEDCRLIYLLGSLAPPTVMIVPEEDIATLHAVTEASGSLSKLDEKAVGLLAKFKCGGSVRPIGTKALARRDRCIPGRGRRLTIAANGVIVSVGVETRT
jgi:hypothetical protein